MIRKVSAYLIAFAVIVAINFVLPRLIPGDPVMAIFGQCGCTTITPEVRAQLIARFALNKPLYAQLLAYLGALAKGDLGYSFFYNKPVIGVILDALPWTLFLVGTAIMVSSVLGTLIGMESGWRRGRKADSILLSGMMFVYGLPDFFIGIVLLLVFGILLGIMPLSGAMTLYSGLTGLPLLLDILQHAALPLTALTIANLSSYYILSRNTMVSTLGEPFVLTARAKGLPDRAVRYHHAGRYSILPSITQFGIQVGRLFIGALLIEVVFSYPGMGMLAYRALSARDYPLLQGIVFIITAFVMVSSLLVDLLYKKVDPRAEV